MDIPNCCLQPSIKITVATEGITFNLELYVSLFSNETSLFFIRLYISFKYRRIFMVVSSKYYSL